ncbi:MAG: amidohydrolase family protein [Chloroflexi bacterium]|nr:amidohydrolase family protein [Chloroflexota bacterium]
MSEILERWRKGDGLPGVLVIDAHTHIGEWPHGENFQTSEEAAVEAEKFMDAYGVDAACVLAGGYMANGADYRMGNDWLLDCVRRAPDRLIPFIHINPNDSQEGVLRELDRMWDHGARCIKLLNAYQAYPGDGPNLMALYEFAQRHRMLVHNHQWSETEIRTISAQFPELIMIRAHGGATRLSHEIPNVYDNIWSLHRMGTVERGIQEYGPEKILFGSDAFMNDISVGIGMVVYADIPDDHKRAVLGLNVARLLSYAGALPDSLAGRLA